MKTPLSLLAAAAVLAACATPPPAPTPSAYANCMIKHEAFAGLKPQKVLSCQ